MVYKHAYLNTFMLIVVKIPLKGEVGGGALNSHGNHIVDHGKSWKNHGIVFLSLCGSPVNPYSAKKKMRLKMSSAEVICCK